MQRFRHFIKLGFIDMNLFTWSPDDVLVQGKQDLYKSHGYNWPKKSCGFTCLIYFSSRRCSK